MEEVVIVAGSKLWQLVSELETHLHSHFTI